MNESDAPTQETSNLNNDNEAEQEKHLTRLLVGIVVVLVLIIGGLGWLYVSSQNQPTTEDVVTNTDQPPEKESTPQTEPDEPPDEEEPTLEEKTSNEGIPVLLSIHMESSSSRVCDDTSARCVTEEEWEDSLDSLERMIAALDDAGLKGTFQHQIHWITRLAESERGIAITQSMIDGGHELAIHRHGFTHNDWDGYSDDPEAAHGHSIYSDLETQSMDEYMEIINDWQDAWGHIARTVEGTDLIVDRQPEWIYQTGDDGNNPNSEELHDPNNHCPSGRPTWSTVSLPNTPRILRGQGITSIGHTWIGAQTGSCTETVSTHILQVIDALDPETIDPTSVINVVFHPKDYDTNEENSDAFDAFFQELASRDFLVGMTVSDYMCERVGECPQ